MHPARIPSYTLVKVRKLDRCKDERRQSCKCLVAAAALCRGHERDINCAPSHFSRSSDRPKRQTLSFPLLQQPHGRETHTHCSHPYPSRRYPPQRRVSHLPNDFRHCTSAQCSSPRQNRYASVARVYVVLAAVEVNLNEVRRPFISMAASQPPPTASTSLTPRRPQNAT